MTYRRRYQGSLQTSAVLDLLLADETNPRSLAFQFAALSDDVNHLPRDALIAPGRKLEQRYDAVGGRRRCVWPTSELLTTGRTPPAGAPLWRNC